MDLVIVPSGFCGATWLRVVKLAWQTAQSTSSKGLPRGRSGLPWEIVAIPKETKMAFLRNGWYMAGWAKDLKPGGIFARMICNEPIVFFRDMQGNLAALEDRCCHRHYPLSLGAVIENT